MKDLLMQLQHVHNQLKDKNEVAIIKGYNCTARRYTIVLTIFGACIPFIFIISQYWYIIGDLPKNVSRFRRLPIMTQYFIDQEKYFNLILLHIFAIICTGTIAILATGTMFIAYFMHICGLFKIACYRIEHAINIHIQQNNITQKNKIWMTNGIIYAVDIHRTAMKLSTHLTSTLETMMFLLIASAVTCTTLNMLQIFQIISSKNFEELFLPTVIITIILIYMFVGNYIGQLVIDHNSHVFFTTYNVQWYRAPLHIQRMILFLLQKESKKFTLTVGGLITASMECFATVRFLRLHIINKFHKNKRLNLQLIKASVSYFTVIYSMQ
ncbi:uncharacterized protein LOC105202587 isoform X1 [Solenopsis invicta]|uniref:uncharacterized protein LOC105202587 isoform X1 n=1 Tax=Solenopsis invicta TaxID=13686 RepID=UPI00193D9348|nr:uncharacterized protein LOC105202587 isoform X1 [Solenopsis invicta]